MSPRFIVGHGLQHEGGAHSEDGEWRGSGVRLGHGVCACGVVSPLYSTVAARRKWHRIHKEAVAWNVAHPIGTPVLYWPGSRDEHGRQSVTRTPAWVIPSGHAVVSVEGYAGGIALSHVDPIEAGGSGG